MISSVNNTEGTLFLATLNFPVHLSQQNPPPVANAIPYGTTYRLNIFDIVPLKNPVLEAQWSPDGRSIALVSEFSGYSQIVLVQNGPFARIGYGG